MTVALATCKALPDLDVDDQRLYRALQQAGVPTEIVIWDEDADYSKYSLCVIRSTWDYVPRREEYVAWAEHVASQTALWNPAPLVHWNSTKAYLQEMQAKGIPIVETQWFSAGSVVDFQAVLQESGWAEMVVKPIISAAGNDTFRLDRETVKLHQKELDALLVARDVMVQPFMGTVHTSGELSFLFFNNEFSHALQKVPSPNDFRVHEHRGGTTRRFDPLQSHIDFAAACLQQVPWPTLYARVDVMLDDQGQLLLSELELTEPSMFLAYDPAAAERFAQAIQQRLGVLTG